MVEGLEWVTEYPVVIPVQLVQRYYKFKIDMKV